MPSGSIVQAMYKIVALTLAVVATSIAATAHRKQPRPVLGQGEPQRRGDSHTDRQHQCAAAPIAGDHESEGRDQDHAEQQDRPLPTEDLARELPQRHCAASRLGLARSTTLVSRNARVSGPTPPGFGDT